ncbi:MAG TPA: spermidine synthase [Planctomycetota bacterium]|nr:spermidine synthase [Planctomycetota bacterium]
MSRPYEELDHAQTRLGELILRRRRGPSLQGVDIYEVKLDGRFLMSSVVNASEVALAHLGLAPLHAPELDVVVGGLGLGCTAAAALDDPRVRSLAVIEALPQVIGWHRRGLVPLGARLAADPRCELVEADFFALAATSLQGDAPPRPVHAVLLDIDHSPRGLLHEAHAAFYEPAGLAGLAARLHPGGVFALWSADPPDEAFTARLAAAFGSAQAHAVEFLNPLLDADEVNTVYVAQTAPGSPRND